MIRLYIDAAVKGKPTIGIAGCGILWVENGQQRPLKFPLAQPMDNHLAEFCGLYLALQELTSCQKQSEWVTIYTDSRIVYDTIQKDYHPHEPYASVYHACQELLVLFPYLQVEWIPEKANHGADQLAKQALALARKQHS
ncbi:MAG: ribonuclease HI family protein [Aerococcus sp.]|nr:ribonuclease HI family protein [Aerococcus sp.]